MKHYLLVGLGALGLVSLSNAQVVKSGDSYLMRVKYTKGQLLKYNSTTSIAGAAGEAGKSQVYKVLFPIQIKVVSILKGKTQTSVTAGPATMSGTQIQPATTMKMELDTRNQSANAVGASAFLAALPATKVKIGSTWTATAPMEPMPGQPAGKLNAKYKFAGLKTVDKLSVAVITYTITGSAAGSGTVLVLTSDGTLYRNSAKVKLAGPMGAITATTVLNRILK